MSMRVLACLHARSLLCVRAATVCGLIVQGQEPTSVIQLTPDTELMPLKTGEHGGKRLHYRYARRVCGGFVQRAAVLTWS